MENTQIISLTDERSAWEKIGKDMEEKSFPFLYSVILDNSKHKVNLTIDIDMGGGFEGGYEMTTLSAPVSIQFTELRAAIEEKSQFKFALHHEEFIDKVGKFFGMEDKVIGYPGFDNKVIVKTNDEARVKAIFADEALREYFQNLDNFSLHISSGDDTTFLELEFDKAITDAGELKKAYNAFVKILDAIDR